MKMSPSLISARGKLLLSCSQLDLCGVQVAVFNKKLYIVNGNYKCEAGGCDAAAARVVELMQQMARSFDVLPAL